mmetsp:Transcript_12683/g.12520  ORF Transcript_12683/g.12520 Transcript_12683/m.12520 type:complete len:108 (-) Transcript_12683:7-330(-)
MMFILDNLPPSLLEQIIQFLFNVIIFIFLLRKEVVLIPKNPFFFSMEAFFLRRKETLDFLLNLGMLPLEPVRRSIPVDRRLLDGLKVSLEFLVLVQKLRFIIFVPFV